VQQLNVILPILIVISVKIEDSIVIVFKDSIEFYNILIYNKMEKYDYLFEDIPACWHPILKVDFLKTILDAVIDIPAISPVPHHIFSAFKNLKIEDLKVIIVGQDPYIQPGEAHGLSFSVPHNVKIPASLRNMYKAITKSGANSGGNEIINGDLTSWVSQGVLLLNSALTTIIGTSNAHAELWILYTNHIISELVRTNVKFCMVLWGVYAQKKEALIPKHIPIFKFKHPSPLATSGGRFEDCDNFVKVNEWLRANNRAEIIWYFGTPQQEPRVIVIFTDGAASANGTVACAAGWGAFVPAAPFYTSGGLLKTNIGHTETVYLSGKIVGTDKYAATNNRAEMGAIYAALVWGLEHIGNKTPILIVSDSLYCINTLTTWSHSWIKKGILEEKKNPDLVLATIELLKLLPNVSFLHMRGHGKDTSVCAEYIAGNESADKLATGAV
jgi:uracil-DNA glycosylase